MKNKDNIKIRSEKISDYNSIANVNYEAFLGWRPYNQYVSEFILVDMLRHNSGFDPELSLVAEQDGKVIGHALFSPFKFIVLGMEQFGVVLAPIAVNPEFQKKGIGKLLIEEGHRKAKEKGFTFSLLCGHVEYYPRFGYKAEMFSLSGTKIDICMKDFKSEGFSIRPVSKQDVPWIMGEWEKQHYDDSLALHPGKNICEWSNHGLECRCAIVLKNNRNLGYVRYIKTNRLIIKELLAKSEDIQDILAYITWVKYGKAQGEIHIAIPAEKLHPILDNISSFNMIDEQTTHKAFMIKILEPESSIARYCEQVEKGQLKRGIIVFPPMFDADEGRTE